MLAETMPDTALPDASAAAAALARANAAHEAGRLSEAAEAYREVLAANPYSPEAEHGLAWLRVQQGDWVAALPGFARALKLRPWEKEFWISQLEALFHTGHFEAVHRLLYRAIENGLPAQAAETFEGRLRDRRLEVLAALVKASGRPAAKAAQAPREELMAMRADFLRRDFQAARRKASALVQRFPLSAFAWRVLGASTPLAESADRALEALRIACDLDPDNVDVQLNLALALNELGRLDEADALYRSVLSTQPANYRALVNRGLLLAAKRDPEAEALLRQARSLDAGDPRIALALGTYLRDTDRCAEALPLLLQAVAADPAQDTAIVSLAAAHQALGQHAEAEARLRQLSLDRPRNLPAHSMALFIASHLDSYDPDALFALHRAYGSALERQIAPFDHHDNDRSPDRRLRIGFVSADFFAHAVAYFIEPIWRGLDAGNFEVFAYYVGRKIDETTVLLQRSAHHWRDAAGWDEELLASNIRKDGIDILIDLSGHTTGHRLPVFARKPAPVQATWIGYPGTTGLSRMDYFLSDPNWTPPEQLQPYFTEKLLLMPANGTFEPGDEAPELAPLPSASGRPFTFGSFNRMSKLTPATIALWSRVLERLPGSRLLVGAADELAIRNLGAQFEARSIEASRLEFLPRCSRREYLQHHARVDVHLDTTPFAGGTTTCHALWMGVPSLVLEGRTLPSRSGVAIMTRAELGGFVARDADEFVDLAEHWASPAQREELAHIRATLRERLARNSFGTVERALHGFEDAMRAIWRRWCRGDAPATMRIDAR